MGDCPVGDCPVGECPVGECPCTLCTQAGFPGMVNQRHFLEVLFIHWLGDRCFEMSVLVVLTKAGQQFAK